MPPLADPTQGLASFMDDIRAHLDEKHRAREQALALSREVIRLSANAIRNVHRGNFAEAEGLIAKGRANLDQTETHLAAHQDIYHAGFVHDSQKEFAEASCTLALIAGRPLPTPEQVGVMPAAYLNGLGEVIGELRRHLLDRMRAGDIEHCEESLQVMGDIYDAIVTMDYPEAVTAGLRRTADAMRGILERTRGDFTVALVQRKLERRLEEFQGKAAAGAVRPGDALLARCRYGRNRGSCLGSCLWRRKRRLLARPGLKPPNTYRRALEPAQWHTILWAEYPDGLDRWGTSRRRRPRRAVPSRRPGWCPTRARPGGDR